MAEGSGRTSMKDQAHFIEIAFGSLMEVDCQIDIAHDLGYITDDDALSAEKQIRVVASLLSGLRSKCLSASH